MYKITRKFIVNLFTKSDPLVYGTAWKILKNEADVQECTQGLCVHALEKCVDRTVTVTPRKYMSVVSWHFTLEFKRQKYTIGSFDEDISTIDQSINVMEMEEFLTFCIDQLSARDRSIIYIQMTEFTSSQCAKKLGITVEAWQKKLSQSRKRLEKKIKQFSSDDELPPMRTPDLESFSMRRTCETSSHTL